MTFAHRNLRTRLSGHTLPLQDVYSTALSCRTSLYCCSCPAGVYIAAERVLLTEQAHAVHMPEA